jgi:hypothetical protein
MCQKGPADSRRGAGTRGAEDLAEILLEDGIDLRLNRTAAGL